MKTLLTAISLISIAITASCDMRSGTAKEEMDKFSGTPTPSITPAPTATPVDPADAVAVDTSLEGETLTVNGPQQKQTLKCIKYDRVMINGSGSVVNISGVCRQVMVNGNENQITADAAAEFVFNGTENSLIYMRFPNGKQPTITQNQPGNTVEKLAYDPKRTSSPANKDTK